MADRSVVVAPAPFKGALSAVGAAHAIAAGVRLAAPDVRVVELPVADGGEGTRDALVAATSGHVRSFRVNDPLGRSVEASIGLLPGDTVVVELSAASGYERLTDDERDPELTSTFGTGELIRRALDQKPARLIVAMGGSATNDGGLGILRALGCVVRDRAGEELHGRGSDLGRVASIDRSACDPRLAGVQIDLACDVRSPFHGAEGAAHVFGPQKGADAAAVRRLDAGLASFSKVLLRETGVDVSNLPGAGAAGGAAGGMVALLGATIVPGAELVLDAVDLRGALDAAQLCITGEGGLDEQSLTGKAPATVAAACRAARVPCVAVCGAVSLTPERIHHAGFAAALPIGRGAASRADALAATAADLEAMGPTLVGYLTPPGASRGALPGGG